MAERVLVTGATGFVGSHLVPALADAGFTVRAAVRAAPASCAAIPPHVEWAVVGSIGGSTDWDAALDGVDMVVHLAGCTHVVHQGRDTNEYYRTNVLGTTRLAEACGRSHVRRVAFLSSIKASGEATLGRALSESDEPRPSSDYGLSKLYAERALAEASRAAGFELAILRPPLVYGPRVRANFLALMRAVDRGIPLPLASVCNRRSMVYVGNLVDAIVKCLAHDRLGRELFLVADDEAISTPDLVSAIAEGLGRRPRLLPVAPVLLRTAGQLSGRTDMIQRLVGSLEVDTSHLRRTLGWRAPFTLRQGIASTAAWYTQQRTLR